MTKVDPYIRLAKDYLALYYEHPDKEFDLPNYAQTKDLLLKKAGVFITIRDQDNNIRGHLGTYQPTQPNLALEIIANTICAATKDPRYKKIKKTEIKNIKIKIAVLSKLQLIDSINELNPKKYGILIKKNKKRGLVLPSTSKIKGIEQQINKALIKAKINTGIYGCNIYKFTCEYHK